MSAVHQFVPMLHRADAVGRHTLRLRDVLLGRGIESRIYVDLVDPETESETRRYTRYADEAAPGDVLVYQFATASDIAGWLAGRSEALVVNYHNITPPEHYAAWDNALARHQLRAQGELQALAGRAVLGLAVSSFNEMELRRAGFGRTAAVPPVAILPITMLPITMLPTAVLATSGSAPTPAPTALEGVEGATDGARRGGTRWLSVGRLAPNKAIEDALAALLVARAHGDEGAELEVVGRPVVPSYTAALRQYADELGLRGAVAFRGALSDEELAASLARADVLVVTSRHEGFGVPVLEAMASGVPVVANDAGALREVVGEGGVLVDAGDPYALAGAVGRVRHDAELRRALAQGAARRLAALDLGSAGDRVADLLVDLAG